MRADDGGKQYRRVASGRSANAAADTRLSLKGRCTVPASRGHRSMTTRVVEQTSIVPQTDKDVSGVAGGAACAEAVVGNAPIMRSERELSD